MQERHSLLLSGKARYEEPKGTSDPNLQEARTLLSLAKMAHTRMSCLRLNYDLLGLIAEQLVHFHPIRVVPKDAQIVGIRTNDPALGTELNWFNSGCSDTDVSALVDALSTAAETFGSPTLQRIFLNGNPRITDASAPGLIRVATSHWSNLEVMHLTGTSMGAENRSAIAGAVQERSKALWREHLDRQRVHTLLDEPAKAKRQQEQRMREGKRKRRKEMKVGCGIAGAFLMLKIIWVIAGWIGDWW